MARATVTGVALSNLVARVEAIRQVLGEIDERYGSLSATVIHYSSDLNPRRDWYLALIEQQVEHVMLEHEDYQNYFYILGINIDEYESRARSYRDQQASYQKSYEDVLEKTRHETPKRKRFWDVRRWVSNLEF
jgi:chromosome segregation ATPase